MSGGSALCKQKLKVYAGEGCEISEIYVVPILKLKFELFCSISRMVCTMHQSIQEFNMLSFLEVKSTQPLKCQPEQVQRG